MNNTIVSTGDDFNVMFSSSKTEKCIGCEVDTKVFENTPIEFRDYYIEGSGQLCVRCYSSIYNQSTYSNTTSIGEF